MTAIPASAFANGDAKLRIWFNDGTNGSQALTPDQVIAATGYSQLAAGVNGTSNNATPVVTATMTGAGDGVDIAVNNAGNTLNALNVTTNGPGLAGNFVGASSNGVLSCTANGSGAAIFGKSTANAHGIIGTCLGPTGTAGYFQNFNTGSVAAALITQNFGLGDGADISISNAASTSNALEVLTNGTGTALVVDSTGGGAAFQANITTAGNIAVFLTNGQVKASIDKTGAFVGPVSDRRLKQDISALPHSLESISKLEGVRFNWKNGSGSDVGVIAQDVEAVLPEAVSETKDGFKIVAYTKLIPLLIESVKELKSQRDDDARRIDALEKQNAALEARLTALENAKK